MRTTPMKHYALRHRRWGKVAWVLTHARSGLHRDVWTKAHATLLLLALAILLPSVLLADTKTWDGKHSTTQIEVTVVYFLPQDRPPLPDWRERVDYYCQRITEFHQREFDQQSTLKTVARPEPFRSARTTTQLRSGDANFIFFQTLQEVHDALKFGEGEHQAFPILLVLSDINWKPLDDFYRLHPTPRGLEHEGNMGGGRHFPGAESGGARATYLDDRGIGWGLVSADGWRVPYSGSDCVVYHEGVGHTVGLPHPDELNNSVMGLGQYAGGINESFLNIDQKERLGWKRSKAAPSESLFTKFRAIPDPVVPQPGQEVRLKCDWPKNAQFESLRVRVQTDLWGAWHEVLATVNADGSGPELISLGKFDRPTPVSYRINAVLKDGQKAELWGYLQVRGADDQPPRPAQLTGDLAPVVSAPTPGDPVPFALATGAEVDLLPLVDLDQDGVSGKWTKDKEGITSPKAFGARIELPYVPPEEYDLRATVEPLDSPHGLILGQRSGDQRFAVLLGYDTGKATRSALENIDRQNVGNPSTMTGPVFIQNRSSQVICSIRKTGVTVRVDGRIAIQWDGDAKQLSLGEYWETPHKETLFLGAYDCRYRVSQLTLITHSGTGKPLRTP